MDVRVVDLEALRSRDPSQISLYLRSTGWNPSEAAGGTLWTLGSDDERIEVLVPANQRMRGYAGFVRELLDALSRVERRPQLQILRDISTSSTDTQYVHTSPDTPSGTIPISDGAKVVESLRQWVLAGAVWVATPVKKVVQSPRKPVAALDFIRGVRLGPTFEGSYVLSVEMPLPPRVGQEMLPLDRPDLIRRELPFGRLVSQTLYTATRAALGAAESVVHRDAGITAFTDHVDDGVTANLCEALAGIGGDAGHSYEIDFRWALSRPSEPVIPLQFEPAIIGILAEAAKELRSQTPEEDVRVVGNVVRLHREGPLGVGEVGIVGIVDDDPAGILRRVWCSLAGERYSAALVAHDEGRTVSVRGDLVRRANRTFVDNVSAFVILANDDS